MRNQEGENLKSDLVQRITNLDSILTVIQTLAKENPHREIAKMRERVEKLIESSDSFDDGRLEAEMAIIADRMDVTEECVRFNSHNQVFLEALEADESQGRKLNFLLQEMNREANTIGSKCSDSDVSHHVVNIKEEVEKLREQIQNIE